MSFFGWGASLSQPLLICQTYALTGGSSRNNFNNNVK